MRNFLIGVFLLTFSGLSFAADDQETLVLRKRTTRENEPDNSHQNDKFKAWKFFRSLCEKSNEDFLESLHLEVSELKGEQKDKVIEYFEKNLRNMTIKNDRYSDVYNIEETMCILSNAIFYSTCLSAGKKLDDATFRAARKLLESATKPCTAAFSMPIMLSPLYVLVSLGAGHLAKQAVENGNELCAAGGAYCPTTCPAAQQAVESGNELYAAGGACCLTTCLFYSAITLIQRKLEGPSGGFTQKDAVKLFNLICENERSK